MPETFSDVACGDQQHNPSLCDFDQFSQTSIIRLDASTQTEIELVDRQQSPTLMMLSPRPELSPMPVELPTVTVQQGADGPGEIFVFPNTEEATTSSSPVESQPIQDGGHPVETKDAATQVSILITSVEPPKLYVTVENSLRLIDDMVYERDVSRELKCLMEAAVQTDDSYLKLARKLENLKMNRAKSLAIWVSPVARRPKTPTITSPNRLTVDEHADNQIHHESVNENENGVYE